MEKVHAKRKQISWLLLLPILALAAIWWKVKNDRFPYVGTWVDAHRTRNGTETGILSFDADGGCTWKERWVLVNVKPENAAVTHRDCSYRMENEKARLELGWERQFFNAYWHSVELEGVRSEVPVVTHLSIVTITPQQNGKVLNYRMEEAILINQKTGQRSFQKLPLVNENFQRVK